MAWTGDDFAPSEAKDDHGARDHDRAQKQNEGDVLEVGQRFPHGSRGSVHDFSMALFHAQSDRWRSVHEDVDHQDLRGSEGQFPTKNQGADKQKQHGGNVG